MNNRDLKNMIQIIITAGFIPVDTGGLIPQHGRTWEDPSSIGVFSQPQKLSWFRTQKPQWLLEITWVYDGEVHDTPRIKVKTREGLDAARHIQTIYIMQTKLYPEIDEDYKKGDNTPSLVKFSHTNAAFYVEDLMETSYPLH